MIDKVDQYIREKKLFSKKDKLLLAISGGADSICLFYILKKLGYHIELAHCNFQLRGRESIEDEEFIKSLAEKHNLNLYRRRFNTNEYAKKNQVSIQMAARNLRYDWFEKLLKKYNLNKIVVAHNNDDKIETFFINLLRGTGLKGLTSIKPIAGNIVRPLLILSRKNIESHLAKIDADYRTDSSNRDIKYLRNKIRHSLMPVLKDINPDFNKIMIKNISNLDSIEKIINENILQIKQKLIFKERETYKVNIKNLLKLNNCEAIIHEIFSEYGFTQIDKIIKACKSQSGKIFYSKNYLLVIDREYIIIEKIEELEAERDILISENIIDYPISMSLRILNKPVDYNTNCANLDFDKLSFPLKLRKWKKGDSFQPLGMNNFKKLSDFFIDQKYSILEKKRQWILCSGKDIIWILGNRIDNRYRVTSSTRNIYVVKLLNSL
tara:strand:+ start:6632 stop:7942 length:1311 start_codon:yes stop_codon:yes gene_type:complete